jgi:predicted ATPase/DNA-binding CsgD family transcriptional regulator
MAGAEVGNLSSGLSSFIGRRRELSDVRRLLSEARLVTLTGVGGTGKTRLALRVATDVRRAFSGGVWFVDLTQLQDPGLLNPEARNPDRLAHLIRATLGLREQGGGEPLSMLVEQLADRHILLVLDNCEHLIPSAAIVAHTLLRGCAGLRILATTRQPLNINGELLFPVPPLSAPDPSRRPSLAEVSRCEAVALFVARAQTAMRTFGLTEGNYVAVADLCHRLDGLPLAIELAAARVRVLDPQQILDRLTDRFTLLSRGNRGAPERQQTLRACVDWSFDLCAEPERVLWARLAVFVGWFELDAVEGICADEALPAEDLLNLVAGLVDKSILTCDDVEDGHAEATRYQMLETIRDYGQERLLEAGEQAQVRLRHRDWYQQLVARAHAGWVSDRSTYWWARLRREHPNLRAAVERCLAEPGGGEAALRIAATLPLHYWSASGQFGEGRGWLDRAIAQAAPATAVGARALLVNSHLAAWQGDVGAARRLLDEGEELARRTDASAELGHAYYIRGLGALFVNDVPVAVETLERAWDTLATAPELDLDVYLNLLVTLGVAAALAGDGKRADGCVQEMLAILETHKCGALQANALWVAGLVAWLEGDLVRAAKDEVEALRLHRAWDADDRYLTALCLETLAWITADQQQHRRAATLLGAADARWTDVGASITAYLHFISYRHTCERLVREGLGDDAYDDEYRRGQALTCDEAVAFALDERRQPAAPPLKNSTSPLTRREREIVDLLAQGLSNKDIAGRLVISQRTAESHVDNILTKLGFANRAQVAAWAAGNVSVPAPPSTQG